MDRHVDRVGDNGAPGEMVDVVDEMNQVVGVVSRREMRASKLRHRAVFIAVIDDQGRLLLHRRSAHKDVWPGWCDVAVGGVVNAGEDFTSAARREVAEEIGLEDIEIEEIDGGKYQSFYDDTVSLIGRCYLLRHGGPFHFQDGEVVESWWSTRAEFKDLQRREPFLPDSVALVVPLLSMWL